MLDNLATYLNASLTCAGWSETADCWGSSYSLSHILTGESLSQYFVRCLAHIINLAAQALISGYSKTKFFDPAHPEAHDPESLEDSKCDVVGLIRAIAVKILNIFVTSQSVLTHVIGLLICKEKGEIQVIARWTSIQPENPSSWHEGSLVIHTCNVKEGQGFATSKLLTLIIAHSLTILSSLSIALCMKLAEKNLTSRSMPRLMHSGFQMRSGLMLRALLTVSLNTYHPHITNFGVSMPTNISSLSHMRTHQVFMPLYQNLRDCTRPGTVTVCIGSMPHLQPGCMLVLPRLKSITTRLQYHMHTPLLCVSSPLIWWYGYCANGLQLQCWTQMRRCCILRRTGMQNFKQRSWSQQRWLYVL